VELMYPFDDAAERFFRSHASGSPGGR
jgi:hypothetical protein